MQVKSLVQCKKSESQILHKKIPPSSHKSSPKSPPKKKKKKKHQSLVVKQRFGSSQTPTWTQWQQLSTGHAWSLGGLAPISTCSLCCCKDCIVASGRGVDKKGDNEDVCWNQQEVCNEKSDTFTKCKKERIRFSMVFLLYLHTFKRTYSFHLT